MIVTADIKMFSVTTGDMITSAQELILSGQNNEASGKIIFKDGEVRISAKDMNQAQINAYRKVTNICKQSSKLKIKDPTNLLKILIEGGWDVIVK